MSLINAVINKKKYDTIRYMKSNDMEEFVFDTPKPLVQYIEDKNKLETISVEKVILGIDTLFLQGDNNTMIDIDDVLPTIQDGAIQLFEAMGQFTNGINITNKHYVNACETLHNLFVKLLNANNGIISDMCHFEIRIPKDENDDYEFTELKLDNGKIIAYDYWGEEYVDVETLSYSSRLEILTAFNVLAEGLDEYQSI